MTQGSAGDVTQVCLQRTCCSSWAQAGFSGNHAGKVPRRGPVPANHGSEPGSEEERHVPGKRHVAQRLLGDVVRRVPVGHGLVRHLPPACGAAGPGHAEAAQGGSLHAHRHHAHEHCGAGLRRRPHQCRHRRSLQGCREEDDPFGGCGFWSGTVLLCAHHLLLQSPGHALAPNPSARLLVSTFLKLKEETLLGRRANFYATFLLALIF